MLCLKQSIYIKGILLLPFLQRENHKKLKVLEDKKKGKKKKSTRKTNRHLIRPAVGKAVATVLKKKKNRSRV
jgi:hypothetical protein